MANKIKGVAFDLEGTVVDLEDYHFESTRLAAEKLGLDYLGLVDAQAVEEKIPGAIGGGGKFISEGISKLSDGRVHFSEIQRWKKYFYDQLIMNIDSIELRDGFTEVISEITKSGCSISIGSLTWSEHAQVIFERSGVDGFFPPDNIVLADDVENLKPKPDVYLETARRMGIDPSEQLVFEDSGTGVQAAIAAGSPVIAMPIYIFDSNIEKLERLGAMRIFSSWKEVEFESLLAEFGI